MSKKKNKLNRLETINIILGVALVLSLAVNIWLYTKVRLNKDLTGLANLSKENLVVVSPGEVYELFVCPCCGRTIDAECCPMATERKNYVDTLIETDKNSSKDDVILAYVKKYGLDSFKDKSKKEEFREKLVEEAPAERPIITIEPSSYDFGDVSQGNGIVTTIFGLKNEGSSDLIINRLETSCGCTTASIIYQDKEGPRYGMSGHGVNEKIGDWQVVIPTGETVQLKVYYDPDTHGDFRGSAIREIYVFSNDPIDFEKKVRTELNQVD